MELVVNQANELVIVRLHRWAIYTVYASRAATEMVIR